jgi:Phage capsid family
MSASTDTSTTRPTRRDWIVDAGLVAAGLAAVIASFSALTGLGRLCAWGRLDWLLWVAAVALDDQFINGAGTGSNMTGLLKQSGTTAGASTGTNGGTLTFAFLADTLAAYDAANADPDRAAWITHSRTWSSVRKLVDSQNHPLVSVDPTQSVRPTLWGKPVFI